MLRLLKVSWRIASDWQSFLPRQRARQRTFPSIRQKKWNRKPDTYLRPPDYQELKENEDYGPILQNIYHVTTNLAGVKSSGRLKSREEIGTSALGGGRWDTVSATYSYNKALEIYKQLHFMSRVARGQVSALDVLEELGDLFGIYDWESCPDVMDALSHWVPYQDIESGDLENQLYKRFRNPKNIYEFYQYMEGYFESCNTDQAISSRVGFMADFADIQKIDPSQIAILQLVVRPGVEAEHVREELELRFNPRDVRVVRWLQP